MTRVSTEMRAMVLAVERGLSFGWSVHGGPGGAYYIGTSDELLKIGVLEPITPPSNKVVGTLSLRSLS